MRIAATHRDDALSLAEHSLPQAQTARVGVPPGTIPYFQPVEVNIVPPFPLAAWTRIIKRVIDGDHGAPTFRLLEQAFWPPTHRENR